MVTMKPLGYNKEHTPGTISPYLPDFIADDITAVDFAGLKRIGVTHILLDLDQTLRRAYSKHLEDEVVHVFQKLKENRTFKAIVIASNNSLNLTKFATPIDARVFQPFWSGGKLIRKPNPKFFARIMRELDIEPSQAAMIGDKLRADIIGANRAGIRTVLIKPRGYDYWYDLLLFSRLRERRYYRQALEARREYSPSTMSYLQAALLQASLPAQHVEQLRNTASNSTSYIAKDSHRSVFIKLVSRQQNFRDLLTRFGQKLAIPYFTDKMPYLGPKHALEHEAKIASLAHDAGVQTPMVEQIIDLGDSRYGLATEYIVGISLDTLPKHQITDLLLQEAWQQIAKLHAAHIAHRDLRAANILVQKSQPWLIDFDLGAIKAGKRLQAHDNAEFLVSTALLVGPKRSTSSAAMHLSQADFRMALHYLNLHSLTRATQTSLKEHPDLLRDVRTAVITQIKKS
jgi:HAD superfamily phosphatase (TIGR01668 family)